MKPVLTGSEPRQNQKYTSEHETSTDQFTAGLKQKYTNEDITSTDRFTVRPTQKHTSVYETSTDQISATPKLKHSSEHETSTDQFAELDQNRNVHVHMKPVCHVHMHVDRLVS